MARNEAVSLTFSADLSKLQKQLASIPGATEKEARIAVKSLERQYTKAEKAAKRAAQNSAKAFRAQRKSIDDSSTAMGRMGRSAASLDVIEDKAGDVDSVLAGLAGALDSIDPKLGAVARGFGDAAGGLEAVARGAGLSVAALGPLAVAATAAAAAYLYFSQQLEAAEKAQGAAAKGAERAMRAFSGFDSAVSAVSDELGKLTGNLDPIEEAYNQQTAAIRINAKAAKQAAESRIKDLERQRKEILTGNRVNEETEGRLKAIADQQERQREIVQAISDREKAALSTAEDLRFAKEAEVEARLRAESAARAEAKASKAAAAESQRQAEAAARAAEEMAKASREREQFAARVAAANAQQADEERAAADLAELRAETIQAQADRTGELADRVAAVTIQYEAQKDALEARIDAAIERGADEVEAAEVYQERLAELELERIEAIGEAEATLADAREMAVQRQIDDAMRVADAYVQLGQAATRAVVDDRMRQGQKLRDFLENNEEHLSKAQKKRIRSNLRAQQQAVTRAFRMQQAADISAIAQNTAVAIMKAFATLGPVAGAAATGAITALGGVQTAAVLQQQPPTFDLGGMVPMGTQAGSGRHTPAMLEAGEAVLTRQGVSAAGGPEGIEALNAGRSSGSTGGPVAVNLMLRHRVLDTVLVEHAGRGGTNSRTTTRTNPYRGVPR